MASWTERISRWSPFSGSRSPPAKPANSTVRDGDFSYITNSDLAAIRNAPPADGRSTDVIALRCPTAGGEYSIHFPTHSIDSGDLTIGEVRTAAAKKLIVADPRGVKLTYRGRSLKEDVRSAREEGLRSGAEILCTFMGDDDATETGTADDDDDSSDTDAASKSPTGRRRRRGGKGKKKKGGKRVKAQQQAAQNAQSYVSQDTLPVPTHTHVPTSAPVSTPASGTATPTTPMGKMDVLSAKLDNELMPLCEAFMANPPAEKAKKDFEHKKLSETVLAQVLLKLDAVETEGDPAARARRKELVGRAQGVLNRLDEAMKG